jgi:hypothetical protein
MPSGLRVTVNRRVFVIVSGRDTSRLRFWSFPLRFVDRQLASLNTRCDLPLAGNPAQIGVDATTWGNKAVEILLVLPNVDYVMNLRMRIRALCLIARKGRA